VGVKYPTQYCLDFCRGSFGYQFCCLHETAARDWLVQVSGIGAISNKDGKRDCVGFSSLSFGGVKEDSYEIIDETVGAISDGGWNTNGHLPGLSKWDSIGIRDWLQSNMLVRAV
jgi:hypothetical protein